MEVVIEHAHTIEANLCEWPKVPQSNFESTEISEKTLEKLNKQARTLRTLTCEASAGETETQVPNQTSTAPSQSLEINEIAEKRLEILDQHEPKPQILPPTSTEKQAEGYITKASNRLDEASFRTSGVDHLSTNPPVEEQNKANSSNKRSTKLGLFRLKKAQQWPEPRLSIGIKCNQLGGNECWKAIGPAQELFSRISKPLGDLLDARVEDLEEGEPIAGHILLFDLYMVGKSVETAQPTLLFTCQRPKPRRRAIKFVKQSGILKGLPKILLAESSFPPLATGTRHLKLLAALDAFSMGNERQTLEFIRTEQWKTSTMFKRNATSTPTPNPSLSGRISSAWVVGPVIGSLLGLCTVLIAIYFTRRRQRKKDVRSRESTDAEIIQPWIALSHHGVKHANPANPSNPCLQTREFREQSSVLPISPLSLLFAKVELGASEPVGSELVTPSDCRKLSSQGSFGLSIVCISNKKRATIGEIVYLNGIYYGLTVAHLFDKFLNDNDDNTSECQEGDPKFAFVSDDDQEVEAPSEVNLSDIVITSQASMSSVGLSATRSNSNSTTSTVSKNETHKVTSTIETVVLFEKQGIGSTSSNESSVLGHLSKSSVAESDLGLDWALIKLSDQSVHKARHAQNKNFQRVRGESPRQTLANPGEITSVSASTGYSGRLSGVLLPGSTMMRLSSRGKFQEVWTVQFDQPLDQGDSGAWVVETVGGGLYGHIVAGTPGGREAYIIPAFKIFENIRQVMGPVEFVENNWMPMTHTLSQVKAPH